MKTLERDEMSEIYAECKRLEYVSSSLDEIERLMGVSEQELLKMQYKKANENGMAQRAVEKEDNIVIHSAGVLLWVRSVFHMCFLPSNLCLR